MSIPLVQKAEKDDINTSIIAIKRNIERINMLLGLVDSGGSDPDLSELATKQELEDAITQVETDLAPVDEVTSGNMQSVTSNAVAEACPRFVDYSTLLHSGIQPGGYTTTEDCYFVFWYVSCVNATTQIQISIDGVNVGQNDSSTIPNTSNIVLTLSFSGYLKKGQRVTFTRTGTNAGTNTSFGRFFKLR
jgi:hypothetical protein